jgi:glutamyl-tRNA reductase
VEVREKVAFDEQALPEALDNLKSRPGVLESMIRKMLSNELMEVREIGE